MDDDIEEKEQSLFRRIEAWTIEWDLHIWYGFISLMAICVLAFIFSKELTVNEKLRDQVTLLQLETNKQQLLIQDLRAENEKQRSLYLLPPISVTNENVDKTASKVNEKIGKVQEILIDKALNQAPSPKVKTETISTTVEVKTVVNKELNSIMKDSYCATVPSAKECMK